ncbi:MAG: hypothetical protein DWC06_02085 [Candidatus Poseidoniales archaeon]|nr:MAG: hypothetical protein DWC06_02085 [Candidatus Poseidoniales archaeon]
MIPGDFRRDEEAVSAAVATVLLFGGVITIIGIMLLSMMPVIQELEGSLKRNDMQAQMEIMGHEITMLSESGVPGDSSEVELIPVDGELRWDRLRGGMWYSASWYEDDTFRIRGALDLDRNIDIRHAESNVQAVCYEDMRLGPDRPFIFTPSSQADSVLVTPKHGLTIPLGPVMIEQAGEDYSLSIGEVIRLDSDSQIKSSHDLTGIQTKGDSGSIIAPPTKTNPATGQGQHWAIPLPAGENHIEVFADDDLLVQWEIGTESGDEAVVQSSAVRLANSWKKTINLTQDSLLEVITDVDAHLLINTNGQGKVSLLGNEGSYLSKYFIAPHSEGNLTISNPNENAATITWRNGGVSVPANQVLSVPWPPTNMESAANIESSENVLLQWETGDNGMVMIPAIDTGQSTGLEFIEDNSDEIINFTSEFEDYSTKLGVSGNTGSLNFEDDGAMRCITINQTASGWISTTLPWKSMTGLPEGQIITSWRDGDHPASIEIRLIGVEGEATHANLATAWAFHISRLTYEFDTSITGLEVAWSAGAIVTNHPELNPVILEGPTDRQGPGPRFSATVPSLHPTKTSVTGSGTMNLDIELTMRESLASTTAYDVRRGWVGPYGDAIASWSSTDLENSEDWIVNPANLDMLKDYVGWVPIPSHGPSEAVWHTGGQPIQFNLQISSLDVHLSEVSS